MRQGKDIDGGEIAMNSWRTILDNVRLNLTSEGKGTRLLIRAGLAEEKVHYEDVLSKPSVDEGCAFRSDAC